MMCSRSRADSLVVHLTRIPTISTQAQVISAAFSGLAIAATHSSPSTDRNRDFQVRFGTGVIYSTPLLDLPSRARRWTTRYRQNGIRVLGGRPHVIPLIQCYSQWPAHHYLQSASPPTLWPLPGAQSAFPSVSTRLSNKTDLNPS